MTTLSAAEPDILGEGYLRRTIPLGTDPDGEGEIVATLVSRTPPPEPRGALLWVHGLSDYFFQTALADAATDLGYAFYALDLRKCGRSRRPGQTPHHITDLSYYDAELDIATTVITEATGLPVVLGAHSTGGLITSLWLDRRGTAGVAGHLLDSPWLDLHKPWHTRTAGTWIVRAVGAVRPTLVVPQTALGGYGESLHVSERGEWQYDLELKPIVGVDVTFGFLAAVRRGHAAVHRGLSITVPQVVLHSDRSLLGVPYSLDLDGADAVLDVEQIARWAPSLGTDVADVTIRGARHDVFLSAPPARERAYAEFRRFLDGVVPARR